MKNIGGRFQSPLPPGGYSPGVHDLIPFLVERVGLLFLLMDFSKMLTYFSTTLPLIKYAVVMKTVKTDRECNG